MDTGFVYRWTNKENGMFYIGSHKGTVDDGYLGGGVYFNRAYKKNPKSFIRDILYIGPEFRNLEDYLLKKLNAEQNEKMYNLKNAAIGGKVNLTEQGRLKLSQSKKGCKNPNYNKSTWNKGLKRKPHVIEAIKKAQTGRKHKRQDVIKRSKYLVEYKNKIYTITELSELLGYKDRSTLSDYINGKQGNKKLDKLNLKKIKNV